MTPEEIVGRLNEHFPQAGLDNRVDKDHAVTVAPVDRLEELFRELRDDSEFRFDLFMDITAVDWLERAPRFDVVYHLYSTVHNHRLRIKVMVSENKPVPSASGVWVVADPMEREVWDMYGIKFSGHPNLTRLLLYEEFKGHPLRKDYPYDKRQPILEETWPSRDQG